MINPLYRTPPAVKNLIIANSLIYLAMYLIPAVNHFVSQWFQLFWVGSPWFHSYQFVSYMFLHGSGWHLFCNMFALYMFGRTLEYELGTRRFMVYYLVCGVGAALFQMAVAWLSGETGITLIGASGAVMGLLLAFGVMHPDVQLIIIPIPVPVKAKWVVIGYAVMELLCGWRGIQTSVAHFAHVGGMLWGLALLMYWKKKGTVWF